MASYPQLLEIGESFEAFVEGGLDTERAAVESNARKLCMQLSCKTVERIEAVQGRYHLLIAGEMWCSDCQLNITAFNTMRRLQPRIDLSIISRGRAEADLKERLGLEKVSIPLVAILDDTYNLVGVFIEKPRTVAELGDSARDDYRSGAYLEDVIGEVLGYIELAEGRSLTHANGLVAHPKPA
jgi:hypothetical protein